MKLLHALLLALLSSTLGAAGPARSPPPTDDDEWAAYKLKFGKSYADPEADAAHFRQFLASREQVRRNAADASATFRLALNRFADYLPAEMGALKGLRTPSYMKNQVAEAEAEVDPLSAAYLQEILNDQRPVPARHDWRETADRVGPVRDQLKCGSCWAQATVGLLEGQQAPLNLTANGLIPLSAQMLVDCPSGRRGCSGDHIYDALQELATLGGIMSEVNYPYAALNHDKCFFDENKTVMSVAAPIRLSQDEEEIKKVVAVYGPVTGTLQAQEIIMYHEGVAVCSPTMNYNDHAILIVGYDTTPEGQDYWIVKNSWGGQWGMGGYMHLARGVDACRIRQQLVIARF